MSTHSCPRCGFESERRRGARWVDRHPVAAVLFALPAGYTLVGVMLVYPWFTIPVTIAVAAWWVDRRNRRRAAIAARADHEHRELIPRAVFRRPSQLPPEPRRRGADHWSSTEPMKAAGELIASWDSAR
jgi:hypothetical protein